MKKYAKALSVILCVLLAVSACAVSAGAANKKKVKKYVNSISISKKATITIPASKKTLTKSYKVTVKVTGKASKAFTVKSSKTAVATAKVSGSTVKVTAKKAGTAKITVTTKAKNNKNKKLSKTLTVTVKKKKAATPTTPKARTITLTTNLTEISRKASSGKDGQGKEQVVDVPLYQAVSVFNYAPANVDELKQVHRADEILENTVDSAIEAGDAAKGRFEVVALYFAALKAFDPKNPDVCYAMMEELCESPTTGILGLDSFNSYSRNALKDNLSKNYKYKYVGNAYFDGAEPSNGYTPSEPPTVTLEDYVYSSQVSNQYQTQVYKIVTRFKGADTERIIQVYQDSIDGKWYIFSDSWMSFTSDMKDPALKYQAQWKSEG